MDKNKLLQLLSTIFLFFYLLGVNISIASSEGIVFLSNNSEKVKIGEEVEIYINIENAKTSAYTSYIDFDETKLEYISGPQNTNVIKNRIINVWYDETGGNEEKQGKIAKYKFKTKEEGIANLIISGEFYNKTGQIINTRFKDMQIQIENKDNQAKEKKEDIANVESYNMTGSELSNTNLETLAIEGVLLYPPFDTNITNYNIIIPNDVENINLLAIPENEKATVNVIGKDDLKEGENKITITVIAEDGFTKKVYIINAHKRNQKEEQEETLYQEKQQETLEQAYKIEENKDERKLYEKNNVSSNSKNENFHIILIILIFIISIIIFVIRRHIKDK